MTLHSQSQVTEAVVVGMTFALKLEKLFGKDHEFSAEAEAILAKVTAYRNTLGTPIEGAKKR